VALLESFVHKMGQVGSHVWDDSGGQPVPRPALQRLCGWNREHLHKAFEQFLGQRSLAVRLATFWHILGFESRETAAAAFEALGPINERLDFLSVIGPMVVMSDQSLCSRASFLFSIYDFNGSGSVNHAEFFIAMRTLFKGLARFFPEARVMTPAEVEEDTINLFEKMDVDCSGLVLLDEVISWAYRSKGLRLLMSPFPVKDSRVFEELIQFSRANHAMDRPVEKMSKRMEKCARYKLRLCPDPIACGSESKGSKPIGSRQRARPWRQPVGISKTHAWVMWKFYSSLSGAGRTVLISDLLKVLADKTLTRLLEESVGISGKAESDEGKFSEFEDVTKIVWHLHGHLADSDTIGRLNVLRRDGEEHISLRGMFCLVWPCVHERDINSCLRWCQSFRAREVLHELVEGCEGRQSPLLAEDLELLFDFMDVNHDGEVSLEELCDKGHVKIDLARKLMKRLDDDNSGSITKGEMRSIVYKFDPSIKNKLKGAFASAQMPTKLPQIQGTTSFQEANPTLLGTRRHSDKRR
jgi:Ca2+-binding EF-hand superfamily protein